MGKNQDVLPHAVATMFAYVTDDPVEADSVLGMLVSPRQGPSDLRDRSLIGTAQQCVGKLKRLEAAAVEQVFVWPMRREVGQLKRFAEEVATEFDLGPSWAGTYGRYRGEVARLELIRRCLPAALNNHSRTAFSHSGICLSFTWAATPTDSAHDCAETTWSTRRGTAPDRRRKFKSRAFDNFWLSRALSQSVSVYSDKQPKLRLMPASDTGQAALPRYAS